MPSTARPLRSTCPVAAASASRARCDAPVVDQEPLGIIVTVEIGGQVLEVEGDQVRREFARGGRELRREIGEAAQQRFLVGARRAARGPRRRSAPRRRVARDARLPQHRRDARVRVLHVVDGVLLGLRAGEVDVEDELAVGLARHQEEAHRVAPDLVDQVAHA